MTKADLAKTMKKLDTSAVEVELLNDGRFRMTSVREMYGDDLGPALAEVPLASVKFVRDVPPELRGLEHTPAPHATAHAERTHRCAASSHGCKFSVRGNSIGRHEQTCPLNLAVALLGSGVKIETFEAFFKAVEKLRGKDAVGAAAGFVTKINREYGSYSEMLGCAKNPAMRALDVIRNVLDIDDKSGGIAEGMLNVARAELMDRLKKAKLPKAKARIYKLLDEVELYFKGGES